MANSIHVGGIAGQKSSNVPFILLVSAIVVLVQIIIVPNIVINGIGPNIILIGCIIIADKEQPGTSCVVGFLLGLAYDLVNVAPMGIMAFMLALVGYTVSSARAGSTTEMRLGNAPTTGWFSDFLVFLVAAVGVEFGYGIVLTLTGYDTSFGASILFRILPSVLYDGICALAFFAIRGHRGQKMPGAAIHGRGQARVIRR